MNIFRPGFLKSVRNGDLGNAEHYIKKDVMKYQNMTAMMDDKQAVHIAAENLDKKMIDLLCRYQAELDCARAHFPHYTPLISIIYAKGSREEKEDMLAHLCEKGAKINFNYNSQEKSNILFHVVASASWDLLPKLIALDVDLKARPGLVGDMIKLRAPNDMIRAVIDAGANIEKHALVGGEALRVLPSHMAAQAGNLEILEYLLAKGLNPNAQTIFNNDVPNTEDDVVRRSFDDRSGKTLALLLEKGGSKESALAEWKYLRQGKSSSEMTTVYAEIEKIMSGIILGPLQKTEPVQFKNPEPRMPLTRVLPTEKPLELPSPWKKLDDESIAHIKTVPALGRRITEIFNFSSCERRTITENTLTKMESTETQKFTDIDQRILKLAVAAFEKQNGTVDHNLVFNCKPIHTGKLL